MINIPIYRAKYIDSDEYVEGDLFYEKYIIAKSKLNLLIADSINHIENDILQNECINENCKIEHTQLKDMLNKLILNERFEHIYEIDPTTLSIHFKDMTDSQGNKIFASLSEDGKGGDILYYEDDCQPYICEHSSDGTFLFEYLDNKTIKNYICRLSQEKVLFEDLKVIGIQE